MATIKNPGITMSNWLGGADSLLPPDQINQAQYSWLINGMNRGGIVQTRPGFDLVTTVPGFKMQGGIIFKPNNSRPTMVLAVDGLIYSSKFPFKSFVKVNDLKFSAEAPIVNFKSVLKSVKLNADGSLTLIPPVAMVIIQDGITRAASFDGTTGKHLRSETPFFGVPIGLWMEWTSSRLWVFNGSRGYVSDLANPDTFSEGTYLAERANFELPAEVTGTIESSDQKSLLVFTDSTTTAFQSSILDRTQWGLTPDFQKLVLPGIGCVAGRSPVNQYGLTWWFSRAGMINLNAALYTLRTSELTTVDGEMMRSKRIMAGDMSGICSAFFESILLCSVPAGGRYNEQTWVADQSPTGESEQAPMAWVGIWTGIRPIVWMKAVFTGRERLYAVTYDATDRDGTRIHVWEAFKDDRRDNDSRISCQMETAMASGNELNRFRYAELDLCEILGPVALDVFVGGRKGPWYPILSTTLQAEIGSIGSAVQKIITKQSILQSFKPQSRELKTEEFSPQDLGCGGVESSDSPGKDKGFQLLLQWRGRMGVRRIRLVSEEDASADQGACAGEGEFNEINILNDKGESIAVPT